MSDVKPNESASLQELFDAVQESAWIGARYKTKEDCEHYRELLCRLWEIGSIFPREAKKRPSNV